MKAALWARARGTAKCVQVLPLAVKTRRPRALNCPRSESTCPTQTVYALDAT